ncbi:Beta-1,3-galactosyl-O-glycosyl-glycoprotein beta-1,6-N-acetylglucosaminyltransferase 4 [Acipenser ruthenus]|uniref:Beta-1,3-galactosyl-O-glycosyl-glycoprotein beta-1,6-N-acetylglucosaminyltransferase 4 n=1 Tax=Acipenser ruthenus TaxID=7906 RepID=A0A444V6R3_ACIRT|nr:Beta-1,3-galactosyl-O-glycosyl-glycoprotein beta-1,6-N-acetylglucosaminyltransferase 4 [Acipenser ruthenus]
MVNLLLQNGADPLLKNDEGKTPWEEASDNQLAELIKSYPLKPETSDSQTGSHQINMKGSVECNKPERITRSNGKRYAQEGGKKNTEETCQEPEKHSTVITGNISKSSKPIRNNNRSCCQLNKEGLQENAENKEMSLKSKSGKNLTITAIHRRNVYGETLLHKAVQDGDRQMVSRMLKVGASANRADYAGWIPLHEAVIQDYYEIALELLKAGANVNCKGGGGVTPLHDAVKYGYHQMAQLLLQHGADPTQQNDEGKPALEEATDSELKKLMESYLPRLRGRRNSQSGASKQFPASLPVPISSVHKRNSMGETRLHLAAKKGDLSLTRSLIEAGVKVNQADYAEIPNCNRKAPPLKALGFFMAVKLLLQYGANPHDKDGVGKCALDQAKDDKIKELLLPFSASSAIYVEKSPIATGKYREQFLQMQVVLNEVLIKQKAEKDDLAKKYRMKIKRCAFQYKLFFIVLLILGVLKILSETVSPKRFFVEPYWRSSSSFKFSELNQNVNCTAIYDADPVEIGKSLEIRRKVIIDLEDDDVRDMTADCQRYIKLRQYSEKSVSDEERQFPLAYSLVVHKHSGMFERLLHTIYMPQNVYCIHYDQKSSQSFKAAVQNVVKCFPNVFIASRLESVQYAHISRLQADLNCLSDLLSSPVQWKYVINLCGQDFPLKPNFELMSELKKLK